MTFAATEFEYKHRYLIHGLIYTLGFAAPWHTAWDTVTGNHSAWFQIADRASRPLYVHFGAYWNVTLVVMVLLALAGAAFRIWGAAYLGASTVQRGNMVGDRVIAEGPYRHVRNPLYLGTVLNTAAICFLMRPEAAALTLVLIVVVQFRLIGREEPYLTQTMGETYTAYKQAVPRLLPALTPRTAQPAPALRNQPNWRSGLLSETWVTGVAITLAAVGWFNADNWEATTLHVMQGFLISLGLSVIARAFIPKATY